MLLPVLLVLALPLAGCGGEREGAAGARSPATAAAEVRAPGASELAEAQRAYAQGNRPLALARFRAAALKGNADAQYYTGLMFADGQGTQDEQRDFDEAARWYTLAAEQSHPDALFALARLYVLGLGVPADVGKALELYERAIEAYPPGENRERAEQERQALVTVLEESASQSPGTAAAPR